MNSNVVLSSLSRITQLGKKRVGRGHGSGKVKTGGRGTKGQKARGKIPLGFEGGQLPLTERLPYLRGKGRNKGINKKAFPLTVDKLNSLKEGTIVSIETLRKNKLIGVGISRVKLLGGTQVLVRLKVTIPCSRSAKTAIEKAGGTVT